MAVSYPDYICCILTNGQFEVTLQYILFLLLSCIHMHAEHPRRPVFAMPIVTDTSIALSWTFASTCFELVNFTFEVFWTTVSDGGQAHAMNVSGNSYNIIDLASGVTFNITLVAFGDGIRSDSRSISVTTASSGKRVLQIVTCDCYMHSLHMCLSVFPSGLMTQEIAGIVIAVIFAVTVGVHVIVGVIIAVCLCSRKRTQMKANRTMAQCEVSVQTCRT